MFVQFQCSDKLGLSLELGSFAAGVMISTTDLAQHTLEQVRLHFGISHKKRLHDDICLVIINIGTRSIMMSTGISK